MRLLQEQMDALKKKMDMAASSKAKVEPPKEDKSAKAQAAPAATPKAKAKEEPKAKEEVKKVAKDSKDTKPAATPNAKAQKETPAKSATKANSSTGSQEMPAKVQAEMNRMIGKSIISKTTFDDGAIRQLASLPEDCGLKVLACFR